MILNYKEIIFRYSSKHKRLFMDIITDNSISRKEAEEKYYPIAREYKNKSKLDIYTISINRFTKDNYNKFINETKIINDIK